MPCNVALDSILDSVGNTPIVRLSRYDADLPFELYGKCEFMNPGGSVKDRIALNMIRCAERSGRIKPGDTLIEPTSGNTGVGISLVGAIFGYKVIIVMPEKMSAEKQVTIEALGAQLIRTPTEAAHDSPDSNFGVAQRLQRAIPNSHILQQFENCDNPAIHYETTGAEICEQMEGRVDYFVAGAGTGGTLTGVGKRLKEQIPNCKIIGADPVGSLIGGGDAPGPYHVEGIGYDFVPDVLDMTIVDEWIKTDDETSFHHAGRLIRTEGMLVGGSTGSVLQAAHALADRCTGKERVVVMLADGIRNYMSKFACCDWMGSKGMNPLPKNRFVDWEELKRNGA